MGYVHLEKINPQWLSRHKDCLTQEQVVHEGLNLDEQLRRPTSRLTN